MLNSSTNLESEDLWEMQRASGAAKISAKNTLWLGGLESTGLSLELTNEVVPSRETNRQVFCGYPIASSMVSGSCWI